MSKLWRKDGKLVKQGGKLCKSETCPCPDCECVGGDQPDAEVTADDCFCCLDFGDCEGGRLVTTAEYQSYDSSPAEGDCEWYWQGNTNCDPFGDNLIDIYVRCVDGEFEVEVDTEVTDPDEFNTCDIAGTVTTDALTIDGSGHITGTVDVAMSSVNCSEANDCTITVAFNGG